MAAIPLPHAGFCPSPLRPVVIPAKAGIQCVSRAKRKSNTSPSATIPLMPRGSHFFCFAKKSNQKKATPTIVLIPAMLRKKRNEKNSLSLKQFFVLIAFFFRFSGPINGDPSN